MALNINIPQPTLLKPKISIFGVGGAGGNALNNMIRSNLEGVEFIAANTDAQSLANSLAANRIQLGVTTTKGLGAGSFPDRGRAAAEENIDEIIKYLEGNNMVFITAGMGGGTGTGAAPVIAKLARERDILTVGVVTKPFQFEGKYRMESAEAGIEELKKCVDTLIIIPNQNLFRIANEQTTFESAFKMADNVLHAGVRGVTDLITMPGLVNLDFADIRTIMTKMGKALMGTGEAEGENRAVMACEAAISNPLLDNISIRGAKGVLVNMTGGSDMTLYEADLAVNTIKKEVDANANIIFGSAFNEDMKGKIRISVVATGIDENDEYSPNQAEDALKTKAQMTHEIKAEPKSGEEDIINAAMSGKKTFFDPGIVKEHKATVIEVTHDDFKDLKVDQHQRVEIRAPETHRQETQRTQINIVENNITVADEKDIEMALESAMTSSGIAFEERDVFDKFSDTIQKLENKIEKRIAEPAKPKKEGGFSLFGFMNSAKSSKIDHDKDRKILEKKVQDKKIPEKKVPDRKVQELPKKHQVIIEDAEINEEEHYHKEERHHEPKQPMRRKVTHVKDDDLPEIKINKSADQFDFSSSSDDDVLNVPAFFRRKK